MLHSVKTAGFMFSTKASGLHQLPSTIYAHIRILRNQRGGPNSELYSAGPTSKTAQYGMLLRSTFSMAASPTRIGRLSEFGPRHDAQEAFERAEKRMASGRRACFRRCGRRRRCGFIGLARVIFSHGNLRQFSGVIPGPAASRNPESSATHTRLDFGFGASHRPGMTGLYHFAGRLNLNS